MSLKKWMLFKRLESDQIEYLCNKYPQEQLVIEARSSCDKAVLGGLAGGISLSLSLRRYMPITFGQFSPRRMLAEIVLIGGMFTLMLSLGQSNSIAIMQPFRASLLLNSQPEYVGLIKNKFYKGGYKNETDLLREIFDKKDFQKWKEDGRRLIQERPVNLQIQ